MILLKFDCYTGVPPTQGIYKQWKDAEKVRNRAVKLLDEWAEADHEFKYLPFTFGDDLGRSYTINLLNHSIVLMTLEDSVKASVTLDQEVKRLSQIHGQTQTPGFVAPKPGIMRPQ